MGKNKYRPRAKVVASTPPGEILYEWVTTGQLTVQQIAEGLEISFHQALDVLWGTKRINRPLAHGLEKLTGRPAHFWLNLQRYYDLAVAEMFVNPRRRM